MPQPSSVLSKLTTVVLFVVCLLLIGNIVRLVQQTPASSVLGQLLGKNICDKPVAYSIGAVDPRFGLSPEELSSAVRTAAGIWSQAAGKSLFREEEGGTLRINLKYDDRQASTQKVDELGEVVSHNRAAYDALHAQYESLRGQVERERTELNAAVAAHHARLKTLEQLIASWNQKGGAPESVADQIRAEQEVLVKERQRLSQDQARVNSLIDQLNTVVVALNQQAKALNLAGVDYNEAAAPLTEEFEEGIYVSEATSTRIDIFQFDDMDRLIRVLTHEFGHALGMEHVSDPDAMMYYLNQGSGLRITAADRVELVHACDLEE